MFRGEFGRAGGIHIVNSGQLHSREASQDPGMIPSDGSHAGYAHRYLFQVAHLRLWHALRQASNPLRTLTGAGAMMPGAR